MKKKKRKVSTRRLLVLILSSLCILWLLIILGFGCFRLITKDSVVIDPNEFVLNEDGCMTLNNPLYKTKTGIDVSSFQREIEWDKVKADGIDFAMIRCGYRGAVQGNLLEDTAFKENITNALANDIEVGVYFYSTAINEIELEEEINFVLKTIKDYNITFPVVYDMELYSSHEGGRVATLSKEDKTKFANLFCKAMKDAGYKPMVYGNKNWLEQQIDLEQISYDLWYAAYIEKPDLNHHFSMWQYTNNGHVDGITTNVDLNLYID